MRVISDEDQRETVEKIIESLEEEFFPEIIREHINPIKLKFDRDPNAYPKAQVFNECTALPDYHILASVPAALKHHRRKKEILTGLFAHEFAHVVLGHARYAMSQKENEAAYATQTRLAQWFDARESRKIERAADDLVIDRGLGFERYHLARYTEQCTAEEKRYRADIYYTSRQILAKTIKRKAKKA